MKKHCAGLSKSFLSQTKRMIEATRKKAPQPIIVDPKVEVRGG